MWSNVVNSYLTLHEDILNWFKVIEWTRFCHRNYYLESSQRLKLKTCVQELWFLHSACWPMLVNIYMKTRENILNILKVKIGHDLVTENATFKVQRGITIKYISRSYGSCTLQVDLLCLIFVRVS